MYRLITKLFIVLLLIHFLHCERTEPDSFSTISRSVKPEAIQYVENSNSLTFYDINIDIDLDLKTFAGTENILYTNNESKPLNQLFLHLYPNTKALIRDNSEKNLIIYNVYLNRKELDYSVDASILTIHLPYALDPHEKIGLHLDFKGQIPALEQPDNDIMMQTLKQLMELIGGGGKASGNYGIYGYGKNIINLGLWYPIVAEYDERGWDIDESGEIGDVSYFDISNFRVNVTVPQDAIVATSGVESEREYDAKKKTITFSAGAVRDFAIQISKDYESITKKIDNTNVNSYYLTEDSLSGEKALEYAAQALATFNEMIGPYPYIELDVVEAPLIGGAAGVEFPSLVTIGDIFYSSPDQSKSNPYSQLMTDNPILKETFEFVVAHEVAHQWWNAVVGSDSKSHPFLDEALANYSAALYFERNYGKEAAEKQLFLQMELNYQLHRLLGGEDAFVDQSTKDFKNTMEYAAIVYGKGGLFFQALRHEMGDDHFFEFLKKYYQEYRFKIATPENMIALAKQVSQKNDRIDYVSHRWLRGKYGDKDIGQISIIKLLDIFVPEDMKETPETELLRDLMRFFEKLQNY